MSRHDLLAELKEHQFETAVLQEGGIDYVFTFWIYYNLCDEFKFIKRQCRV